MTDQQRDSGATEFVASVLTNNNGQVTSGDEPLIVDWHPAPLSPDTHMIVTMVSFLASLSTRAPAVNGILPLTGLFVCAEGITPAETLANAQAGWNPLARGLMLPLNDPYSNASLLVSGGFAALGMSTQVGFRFPIPYGYFLRAIVTCQAGAPAPGPGVNSSGILRVLASLEVNC